MRQLLASLSRVLSFRFFVVFIVLGDHVCINLVFRFNALSIWGTLCVGTSVFECVFVLPLGYLEMWYTRRGKLYIRYFV